MSFYTRNSSGSSNNGNKFNLDDEAKSLNKETINNDTNNSKSPSLNSIDGIKKPADFEEIKFKEAGEYLFIPAIESKRWLILAVFCMIYMINFFHLTQYGDLQNALIQFYNLSMPANNLHRQYDAANWLSVIHMITNLIFIFPAMFLLDYKGLKLSCLIAIGLTTIGSWIKCSSVRSDLYGVLITGQLICGIAQAFTQSCLVKLPALWFGKYEVATAISVWIFLLIVCYR
jgi:hypothetical protein